MAIKPVIILISLFSGRKVYVETTEEKWKELTRGVEVVGNTYVDGWDMDQDKIERIVYGSYPEREDYKVIEAPAWKPNPPVDYLINYSSRNH